VNDSLAEKPPVSLAEKAVKNKVVFALTLSFQKS
jgi:hypothetical protein